MGSSSGNKTSIAVWESTPYCSCDADYYKVPKVRWKSVPMCGKAWATTGRILSLGISEFAYKGQSYSHDCI